MTYEKEFVDFVKFYDEKGHKIISKHEEDHEVSSFFKRLFRIPKMNYIFYKNIFKALFSYVRMDPFVRKSNIIKNDYNFVLL